MSGNSAIQELVQRAMGADPGSGPFIGADGLSATLVVAPSDEARFVQVRSDSGMVYSSCSVEAGAQRPAFYPDGVPFKALFAASVVWGVDSGTLAVWPVQLGAAAVSSMTRRLKSLPHPPKVQDRMDSAEGASPDEWHSLISEFSESVSQNLHSRGGALQDLFSSEGTDHVEEFVTEIIEFHQSRGWATTKAPNANAPSVRASFRLKNVSRRLTSMTVRESTTVILEDDGSAS